MKRKFHLEINNRNWALIKDFLYDISNEGVKILYKTRGLGGRMLQGRLVNFQDWLFVWPKAS